MAIWTRAGLDALVERKDPVAAAAQTPDVQLSAKHFPGRCEFVLVMLHAFSPSSSFTSPRTPTVSYKLFNNDVSTAEVIGRYIRWEDDNE
jgi:hypothetical protein